MQPHKWLPNSQVASAVAGQARLAGPSLLRASFGGEFAEFRKLQKD